MPRLTDSARIQLDANRLYPAGGIDAANDLDSAINRASHLTQKALAEGADR